MVTMLGALAWVWTLALAPAFGYLALVALAALTGGRASRAPMEDPAPDGSAPRFLVVIPAHDEEANIGATVASVRAARYDASAFTVLVIADNCSDATARAARAAGAEVYERFDATRRSKGYALEDVFTHLARHQPHGPCDALVVIDADTVVDPDLLAAFARRLKAGVDWAQAYYSVSNPDVSWRTRLLTYALSLFNGVWLLGQDRLGLSVGFRGNGMLFSWRGLERHPWRAYGLVEDQEFSWQLRVAGERARFVPEARVYAEMVSRGKAAVSQRRRWEEGRRQLAGRFLRPLLESTRVGPLDKLLGTIELLFPPLMRLFALLGVALLIHPLAWLAPGLGLLGVSLGLIPVHAAMVLVVGVYAISPFVTLGLPWRYALSLARVPYFAAWKVAATLGARTKTWVRTQREAPTGQGR